MPRSRQENDARKTLAANPGDWSDEKLLLDYARRGSRASFETLVRRHEQAIFRYLRKYLGADDLAEDAFQATFLQLHLKCDRFTPGRKVRPWLYRIATNQAIDLMRRNRRRRALSLDHRHYGAADGEESLPLLDTLKSPGSGPAAILEAREERQRLYDAIGRTPPRSHQVLTLVLGEGLTYREAAEVLAIPVGTVKSRLSTAIRRLQEILRPESTGVDPDHPNQSYYRGLPLGADDAIDASSATRPAVALS